jgi:copper chaperone CopZ
MNCAGVVMNAVASLPGVKNPKVHVENQTVVLELDEERTSEDEVTAAIERQGFEVLAVEDVQ